MALESSEDWKKRKLLGSLYTEHNIKRRKERIFSVCNKANTSIAFLKWNFQISQHINGYTTLVRPQVEYAAVVWGPYIQETNIRLKWFRDAPPDIRLATAPVMEASPQCYTNEDGVAYCHGKLTIAWCSCT